MSAYTLGTHQAIAQRLSIALMEDSSGLATGTGPAKLPPCFVASARQEIMKHPRPLTANWTSHHVAWLPDQAAIEITEFVLELTQGQRLDALELSESRSIFWK